MKISKENQRLVVLLLIIVVSCFAEFALNATLARLVDQVVYGDISVLFSMFRVAVPIFLLGSDGLVRRHLPALLDQQEQRYALRRWIRVMLRFSLLITLSLAIFLTIVVLKTEQVSRVGDHYLTIVALYLVPFVAVCTLLNRVMECVGHFYLSALVFQVGRYVLPLVLIFCCSLFIDVFVFKNIIGVLLINYAVLIGVQCFFLFWKKSLNRPVQASADQSAKWTRGAASYLFINLSLGLMGALDLILLGLISDDSTQVAQFSVILVIASFQFVFSKATSIVFNPKASRYVAQGDMGKLQALLRSNIVFNGALGLILPVGICIYVKPILAIFGAEYTMLSSLLVPTTIAIYVVNLMINPGVVVLFTDYHNKALQINLASVALSVTLCFLLIPVYGVTGAVISCVTTMFISNFVKSLCIKKYLGARPFVIF